MTAAAAKAAPALALPAALSAIMGKLPAIGKDQTAPGGMGGFKYRGIEQMTRILQPLLAEHGVTIIPNVRAIEIRPAPGQKESWQDAVLHVDWTIIGPDGSTLQASTIGIGRDVSDKNANKAQTQAFKYLLMHLFCVSDADDDADGHDYTQGEPTIWEGTWTRVLASIKKYPESAAILKALAELMEHKLTLRSIQEDEDFHQAVIAQLDDLDIVAAADAAHADEPPSGYDGAKGGVKGNGIPR